MSKAEDLQTKPHKTAILVLGVDDEANCTLLRVLGALGCALPADMRKSAEAHPLGGFEPAAVRGLNAKLFDKAGARWDDASPFHPQWRQSPGAKAFVKHAVMTLEDQFGNAPLFALGGRDIPRLFPLWAEALRLFGCNVRPIVMMRNPLESGQRIQDSEECSQSLAEIIWVRHALDAEHFTRGTPRYFASFERLCQSWDLVVQDAQEALQLVWPKPPANVEIEIAQILGGLQFSKDLQSRSMTSTLLPQWIRETYKILNGWAMSEEMASHHNLLDSLRADFDVAADAFGRVVRAERNMQFMIAEAQRERMQGEIALLSQTAAAEANRAALAAEQVANLKATEEELKSAKAALQEQRRTTTLLNAEMQELKDSGDDLESELRDARAEVAATRARRKEMARVIANRDAQLKVRYQELAQLQQQIMRSDPLWWMNRSFARLKRRLRGSGTSGARSEG